MNEKDYLKDIQDIKSMMINSSQFLSLSGFSGILAGIYSLIGAFIANTILTTNQSNYYQEKNSSLHIINYNTIYQLIILALLVLLISIATGLLLSSRKAKKQNQKLWNNAAKKLLINFSLPLLTGGIFAVLLIVKQNYNLIATITLVFYGLACVNASKNTYKDVNYLGITLIILGLLSTYYCSYGLLFWTLGFGIGHIIYGSLMYFKYDKK